MRLRLNMKFLLELVTCCGASTFRQQAPAEETRSLVPPPETHPHVRRRKKARVVVMTRRGRPVAEWRPSLSSISEDTAPPEKSDGAAVTNRKIRKVASAASAPKPPQYRDETGRSAGYSSSIVPTLSPTPFLF